MRSGELRASAASLDCIAFDVAYNQVKFTNLKARSFWPKDHLQECQGRRRHGVMMTWQLFEFHEERANTRKELYMTRDGPFASMEPPLMI